MRSALLSILVAAMLCGRMAMSAPHGDAEGERSGEPRRLSRPAAAVELPPPDRRAVLGIWLLPQPINCTRAIERAEQSFFLVARCPEIPAADGTRGLRLQRMSDRLYVSEAGVSYSIDENGRLIARDDNGVMFTGEPYPKLWPDEDGR
jgi:hypothetical protein